MASQPAVLSRSVYRAWTASGLQGGAPQVHVCQRTCKEKKEKEGQEEKKIVDVHYDIPGTNRYQYQPVHRLAFATYGLAGGCK